MIWSQLFLFNSLRLRKIAAYSNIYKNFRINISTQKFLIIYHQLPCIKTFSDVIIHVTIEMKVFLRTLNRITWNNDVIDKQFFTWLKKMIKKLWFINISYHLKQLWNFKIMKKNSLNDVSLFGWGRITEKIVFL